MSVLHAIVLGIVQGLSEFLPISSSGHLDVVPWFLGWEELSAELDLTFDVALHVGTFLGALVYFRADVAMLVRGAVRAVRERSMADRDQRLAVLLALASVPAATVGAVLDAVIDGQYGPIWIVGVMLIVFGVVLFWADARPERRGIDSLTARDAVLMGAAQALALQPGVSRSGATISMGRWLQLDRDAATRMSFLMSLPITAGAFVYKAGDVVASGGLPDGFLAPFLWGIAASGVTGFVAVWGLLRLVRTRTFAPFVVYRLVIGVVVILVSALR
ncbi:MAG TPA: undecaprenyl-diphosphate phosphatase [Acidimicrobiales bacterium]|nr:undecaprenyl-diphosphate phosphatase [Acidimicrobiales bacterium]